MSVTVASGSLKGCHEALLIEGLSLGQHDVDGAAEAIRENRECLALAVFAGETRDCFLGLGIAAQE